MVRRWDGMEVSRGRVSGDRGQRLRASNLVDNGAGGGAGIGGGGDWPSHDDVAGAGSNCFRGSDDSALVVSRGTGGANARIDDGEAGPQLATQFSCFLGRANDAPAAGGSGQGGQPERLIDHAA